MMDLLVRFENRWSSVAPRDIDAIGEQIASGHTVMSSVSKQNRDGFRQRTLQAETGVFPHLVHHIGKLRLRPVGWYPNHDNR